MLALRRLLYWILLSLIIVIATRLLLNRIVGIIVTRIFANGTGCVAYLERPWVSFFPLGAHAENVNVYHRSEGKEKGFKAREISVRLSLDALFKKRIVVEELDLFGASVHSIGEDTGFFRTLEFLFADSKKPPPSGSSWHSFLSGGWTSWVPKVVIKTDEGVKEKLILGTEDFRLIADEVEFISRDPVYDPSAPVLVTAKGSNVRLQVKDTEPRGFGTLDASGKIGGGKVSFDRVEVRPGDPGGADVIYAQGSLLMPGAGAYKISVVGDLHDNVLGRIVNPSGPAERAYDAHVHVQGLMGGELVKPNAELVLSGRLKAFGPIALRDDCQLRSFYAAMNVDTEQLAVRHIRLDDVLSGGNFFLALNDTLPFSADGEVGIDQRREYLRRCVGQDEHGKARRGYDTFMQESFADARTVFQAKGELFPLKLEGSVKSDIMRRDPERRELLTAEVGLEKTIWSLKLNEHSVAPPQSPDTPSLSAELTYDTAAVKLSVPELHISKYPAPRLVLKVTPFLSEESFDRAEQSMLLGSLLDAKGQFDINLSEHTASGSVEIELTKLAPAGIDIDRFSLPLTFDERFVRSKNILLSTKGGDVRGELTVDLQGSVQGSAKFADVKLEELQAVRRAAPGLRALASGEGTLRGPWNAMEYDAEVRLSAEDQAVVPIPISSQLTLTGNNNELNITGSLFDGHGSFELTYPLGANAQGKLKLNAKAKEFPLDPFLNPPEDPAAAPGVLTAEAFYEGPKASPLRGAGKLEISELNARSAKVLLKNPRRISMNVQNGRLTCTDCAILVDGQLLNIGGYLDQESGWNANISGHVALGEYLTQLDFLEQLSGSGSLELSVVGPLTTPRLDGQFIIAGGSVSLPLGPTIIGAEDVDFVCRFNGDSLTITKLSANIGEGRLSGSGSVESMFDNVARRTAITLEMKDVLIEPVEYLTMNLGGKVELLKAGEQPLAVNGDIVVSEALYENEVRLTDVLERLRQTLLGEKRASTSSSGGATMDTSDVELQVRIQAQNGLVIDTNIAQAELRGDLTVLGSPSAPRIDGKVEVIDGSFGFESNRFDILQGVLRFSKRFTRPDPAIDLIGETSISGPTTSEQQVRLIVGGRLSNPRVSFTSETGLSEREVLAAMSSGGPVGGIRLVEDNAPERTFRELISPTSGVSIQERLAGLTGFKDVQIKTGVSRITGEFVPKVEAKRPLTEEVDLDIQSELSSQQTSDIGIEYELTPYLSFLAGWTSLTVSSGSSDTSGTYRAGFRYRRTFPGFLFWRSSTARKEG